MAHELIRGISLQKSLSAKMQSMPADHTVGAHVPKGGSMCGNCRYGDADKQICNSSDYKREAGTDKFVDQKTGKVVPGDEFCCDYWEHKK